MLKILYQSLVSTVFLVLIVCGAYPLLITGIGQLVFPSQATGSLIRDGQGKVIGSRLIGQAFTKPEYFHGRPSAAGSAPSAPNGYDAANSSGSNLGPTNQKFADGLKANVDSLMKDNPHLKKGDIPGDLVTASASGLDPHISPEGALAQIDRVAGARALNSTQVEELVRRHIEGPDLGFLGESVVNVLSLNLDLDEKYPVKK